MNDTSYTVDFSDLRFNKYYVLVYNIAIRQLVTGENFGYFLYYRELMTILFGATFLHLILARHSHLVLIVLFLAFIPFIMIVSFNVNTFVIINRRQKLSPRLHNTRSQVLNHQAARQSYVLLAILVVFGICHIPRFVLGNIIIILNREIS